MLASHFIYVYPSSFNADKDIIFQIKIREQHFCYAHVVYCQELTIEEILKRGYGYIDAGYNAQKYKDYLRSFYPKYNGWKDKDTLMKVICFEKLTQLDLFGDYLDLIEHNPNLNKETKQ